MPATAVADVDEVRQLFGEYAAELGVDLSFQGFAAELAGLPGDYAPPRGVLLLARIDGAAAGCVAAHAWQGDACEMKRLFVRPAFRACGCGRALTMAVIDWARAAGFARILLDTLPSMREAQQLYLRLGFHDTAPYRFNPVPGARFLELRL